MSNGMQRQHGIGSYNKGCKCESCVDASRSRSRRARQRDREARGVALHPCFICDLRFATPAAALMHETVVH